MIRLVLLGGFLGAGKTTTMLAAGRAFEGAGERVALVTNDQGVDLVDTHLARASGLGEVAEVTGGCFCCRFDDLVSVVTRMEREVQPTVVLAEAVGSCTDMQSTVVRPLRRLYGDRLTVCPLTVLVDPMRYSAIRQLSTRLEAEPDLAYLYRHQLDEADIIAVNKADLLDPSGVDHIQDDIHQHFPHATVTYLSAATGYGIHRLLALWASERVASEHRPFDVDYGRYGAAEAELAWTNQTFDLRATADTFAPGSWAEGFLGEFSNATARDAITIGHVKIRIVTLDGATKASLTQAGEQANFDERQVIPTDHAQVTLNARVKMSPSRLDGLIAACVQSANRIVEATASDRHGDVFQPGFPVPVHRM